MHANSAAIVFLHEIMLMDCYSSYRYANYESRKSSVTKKVDNPIYGKERCVPGFTLGLGTSLSCLYRPTHTEGQSSVYPPIVESTDYEPINPNEAAAQSSLKVQLSSCSAEQNIYRDIPEDEEDDLASNKLNYETIVDEQNPVSTAAPLNLDVPPTRDSMIDNTAYNTVTYDIPSPPAGVNIGARGTEEHIQYEEVVALQMNTSYEYVKMAAAGHVTED